MQKSGQALGSVAYIHIFGPERGCLFFLQSGKSISTGSGTEPVDFGAHKCIFLLRLSIGIDTSLSF